MKVELAAGALVLALAASPALAPRAGPAYAGNSNGAMLFLRLKVD